MKLLLLSHELLRNEIQIVSSLVLLHDLEHVLNALSEFLIALRNPQLLLVLYDLDLDPFLCQRD